MIVLCILKSIVAWLIFMFVGTNLVGFVVRGFLQSPRLEVESLRGLARRYQAANVTLTLLSAVAMAAYLFALYHFWNIALAAAAALIMIGRVPDLIWEIKTGRKITRRTGLKGFVSVLTTIGPWLSLLLVWYALCW